MIDRRILSLLGMGCAAVFAVVPACAGEPRALIELFTSQGCSSCPPADKLLGEFSKDSSLVALSLPINYWDYLGWKDTLALPGHAARQRAYAHGRGDREVYTPQVVVNGLLHALGSDKAAIEQAITKSRSDPETLSVPVRMSLSGDKITVSVPAGPERAKGDVWFCGVLRVAPVTIGRGENRGRTVTYHNVVRGWQKLGEWTGSAGAWTISLADLKRGVNEAAVIVQESHDGDPGRVLGAALIPLR